MFNFYEEIKEILYIKTKELVYTREERVHVPRSKIFYLNIKKNNLKRVKQKENNGQQKSVSPGFYI